MTVLKIPTDFNTAFRKLVFLRVPVNKTNQAIQTDSVFVTFNMFGESDQVIEVKSVVCPLNHRHLKLNNRVHRKLKQTF